MSMLAEDKIYEDANHLIFKYDDEAQSAEQRIATLVGTTNALLEKLEFNSAIYITINNIPCEYKVKSIKDNAFENNDKLQHVVIPEGVTSIGNSAFSRCTAIRLIEFPSSISQIGTNAFWGCSSLDFVSINSSNVNSALRTYLPTNQYMTLFVPEGYSDAYKNANLEKSWTSIFGNRIFEGEMKIVSYTTNDNVVWKFVCATNKTGVKEAILYIGNNDKTVKNVTVPSTFTGDDNQSYNVVGIGRPGFFGCSEMLKLKIENSLDFINKDAFSGCGSLSYIGWQQRNPGDLKPSIFPTNELMTLFVPDGYAYNYRTAEWNNQQFGDRIYDGEMKETPYDGMTFIYADGSYEKLAVLVEGKDAKSVTIPSNFQIGNDYFTVKTIGRSAFENKNIKLETVNVDYGIRAISSMAFQNCSKLQKITLPSSLVTIGKNALNRCSSLTELTLPSNLSSIGDNAFSSCSNLIRVESKMSNPISIPNNLFTSANSNDKILYLPQGRLEQYKNKEGWNNGFSFFLVGNKQNDKTETYKDEDDNDVCNITLACTSVSNDAIIVKVSDFDTNILELPTAIGNYNIVGVYKDAFSQSGSSLTQLSFADKEGSAGLTIGKGALNGCNNMKILKLPSRLEKIGSGAFNGCNNLAHVLFKNNSSILGSNEFNNIFSANTTNNATIYIPSNSANADFENKGWNPAHIIKADELEEFIDGTNNYGMKYIGWKQNGSDTGTAKLTFGVDGTYDTPMVINKTATSSATSTTYNVIGIANDAFRYKGIFNTLRVSEGIETIGANAFRSRGNLKKVILPKSLKSIGEDAFYECGNLTDIEWASNDVNLTIEDIGASAFQKCASLEKVTLPSSLKSIGANAFAACSKLVEIESKINSNPLPVIDNTVFPNYSATLYVPFGMEEAYSTAEVWKLFGNHISVGNRETFSYKGLNYVYATYGKTATVIKSIPEDKNVEILSEIPDSLTSGRKIVVTTIAESAFKDKTKIESLFIPDGVTCIGAKAFENCSNLKKIELPKTLVSIGDYAFGNCGKIGTIISKIPAENLAGLTDNINKVFISDNSPTISISPDIYIPVGENSKSLYKQQWTVFDESKFIVGYPTYDKESDGGSGWFFDYLTTCDDVEDGDDNNAGIVYGTATLLRATERVESDGNLVVPDEILYNKKKYKVIRITDNAFNEYPNKSTDIKQLNISEGIKEIGANAFSGFSKVERVWLPSSIETIGKQAFNSCNSISYIFSKINSPSSMSDDIFSIPTVNTSTLFVPSMKGYDTDSWGKFSNIIVGDFETEKKDGDITFACYKENDSKHAILTKAATNIKEAKIKGDEDGYVVETIGKYAFQNCSQLTKLEFPSSLIEIGNHAFDGCSNIKTIISAIPGGKLGSLNSDYSIVFAAGLSPDVIYVPVGSMNDYLSLWGNDILFANDKFVVGTPGYYAQSDGGSGWYYDYLTTEPETSTAIFMGTAALVDAKKEIHKDHELIIPDEVLISGKKYKVTRIDNNALYNYPTKQDIYSLKVPENITEIGKNAFQYFTKVEKVWLLGNITSIDSKAFDGCTNISRLCSEAESLSAGADVFSTLPNTATLFVPSEDGYTTDGWKKFSNIIKGKFDDDVEDGGMTFACYTVEGDGNTVPDKKFAILTKPIAANITEALINDSVKIEGGEDKYEVSKIGKFAFKDCNKLTKIELPKTLKSIDAQAFAGCTISEIVSNIDNLFKIDESVFSAETYSKAIIYIPEGTYGNYTDVGMGGWSKFDAGNGKYQEGKWKESEFMGYMNSLKYKYHTGTHEAEIIEISYPNNPTADERTLTIESSFWLSDSEKPYYVTSIAPAKVTNGDKIEKLVIEDGNANKEMTIGTEAFKGWTNLTTVTFPSNLTIIDARAFSGCANLSKLEFPSALRTIGTSAFQNCTNLQKIWLPASLTSIGSKAFDGCRLTRVCLESILPLDNPDAFSSKSAFLFVPTGTLGTVENESGWRDFSKKYEGRYIYETSSGADITYIYLEQSDGSKTAILTKSPATQIVSPIKYNDEDCYVTVIGESAFSGDLREIKRLPEGIKEIEKNAFKNCRLQELMLPSTLRTIGDGAFSANNQLSKVSFPDNLEKKLESIGNDAFKGCSSLKQIELPQTLKTIGIEAFGGDVNLEEITLPAGIESINEYAFQNCSGLKNFVLPSTLTTIGANIFDGCNNLSEVISLIKTKADIGGNAQSLANAILYVPQGTKDDYKDAGWEFLHIIEGDRKTTTEAGVEYAYGDKEAIVIGITDNGIKDGTVTIPGTFTIGEDEYDVIDIEKELLSGNTNVKSVTIGKKVKTIGASAFKDCSNLRKLELPSTLTGIGENAFAGCDNLTDVVCYSQDNDFITKNKQSFPYATLYVPQKSLYENVWEYAHIYEGERTVEQWKGMTFACFKGTSTNETILVDATETKATDGIIAIPPKITIGEGNSAEDYDVVAIASKAFSGNTDVKLVELPASLTSIDANAFEGCTNLAEVVSKITDTNVINSIMLSMPNAILFVPNRDWYENTGWNFAHIYAGDRKTDTQNGMSYVCATGDKEAVLVKGVADQLGENVTIPNKITIQIGEGDSKEDLECNVVAIAANAFKDLAGIKTVKINENVKSIGASAFQGCSSLIKVWLPASFESIADKAFYDTDIDYLCTKRVTPIESTNIGSDVFFPKKATLYVPEGGALDNYAENEVWKTFPVIRDGYFVDVITKDNLSYDCIQKSGDKNVAILIKSETTDKSVEIPSTVILNNRNYNVTTIYKEAFRGNNSKNLEKIVFPETLETIEDNAFDQCSKLAIITAKAKIPAVLGENVFAPGIKNTATLYVPNDAEVEAKYKAAKGWKEFDNWAQGEKKTDTKGSMTYEYLKGVGTATLIGSTVNKEEVTIDGTVEFEGETYTVTAIAESAFKNNPNRDKMTKLKIAKNITTIGANAFQGCNNLKMVWLPATMETIDQTAFGGCNNVRYVSSSIDTPKASDANIFPSDATLFVPQERKSNYNISGWNNFAYVAEGTFVDVAATDNSMKFDCYTDNAGKKKAILKEYNANASVVEIPGSVKVGNDSYTVSIITKQAFKSKTNMENLVIPSGVETIEAETFSACSKLKWIESKIVNPISISNVFANTNATLFILSNVSDYKAKGWNFLNVFVGERKQTDVDGWTYVYSTGDKKAVLTRVGNVGTNVTINGTFKIGKDEYTVTSVGDAVFKGKSNIEALTIAKSIENIGANAFEGCVKLVSITCEGSSPAKLGADAFPSANVTVNVPNDAVNTYKNHPDWKPFANNILGITTSVEDDPTGAYNIIVPAGGDATPEVEIWNGLDASGDVVIPEVVELNGSDYKVTGIAANAYDSNTDLTSIVIPSSITSIGASAFAGCTNLKSITVYCVTPINLSAVAATRRALTRAGGSSSVFEGVNKETCILYVPAESIDAYKQAEGWKDFKKIYAIGATAINGIVISEGKPFDVYNLQGRKVKANTTTFSGLPAGVYIVNGKKVMVK